MRKILAILAALAVGQFALANSTMTTSAELRARGEAWANTTGNKDNGKTTNMITQRLKLGLDFNAGEKFSAHVTAIHNSDWGQAVGGKTDSTNDSGLATHDGTGDAQNLLTVDEAYGTWVVSDSTAIRFGRGSFQIADGSVVGTNDWEDHPTSYEGMLFTHDMEFGRGSLFYVRTNDWAAADSIFQQDAEAGVWGLSFDIKSVPDMIKMLNVHILKVHSDEFVTTGGASHAGLDAMRYGLTVAGETSGIDFKLTYAMDSGENKRDLRFGDTTMNDDISANMMDVNLGYTMAAMMNFHVGLMYHSDTGCDAACQTKKKDQTVKEATDEYTPFFYNIHENGGQMDVFKWGNLTYTGLNLHLMPMDDLSVGLNYIILAQTQKEGGFTTGRGGAALNCNAGCDNAATESALGTEIDLWAKKKYDNGFSILARYGQFAPGDEFKSATAANDMKDTISEMFLEAMMTF